MKDNNLTNNSEYAGELKELKQKLKTFQEETGEPWSLKWVHK